MPEAMTPARTEVELASLADRAVEAFVAVLGGRHALASFLAIAADDAAVAPILNLLDDDTWDNRPLGLLCREVDLTVADFFRACGKARLVAAHLAAKAQVFDGLSPIVADLVTRAAPHQDVCPRCDGATTLTPKPTTAVPSPTPVPCPRCHATGSVKVSPDLDRQKLVLELADLLQPKGPLVQQNTLVQAAPAPPQVAPLEILQTALRQAISSRPSLASASPAAPTTTATAEGEVVG